MGVSLGHGVCSGPEGEHGVWGLPDADEGKIGC